LSWFVATGAIIHPYLLGFNPHWTKLAILVLAVTQTVGSQTCRFSTTHLGV
jgi:hypothetical protein